MADRIYQATGIVHNFLCPAPSQHNRAKASPLAASSCRVEALAKTEALSRHSLARRRMTKTGHPERSAAQSKDLFKKVAKQFLVIPGLLAPYQIGYFRDLVRGHPALDAGSS